MKQSLKGAVAEYLEFVTSLKSKSSQSQEKIYFRDLETHFKDSYLSEINSKSMEFFQASLVKKKKPQTVNRQFTVYNHFFKKCVEWNYLTESPTKNIKKRRELEPIRELWTDLEINKILTNSHGWFRDAFEFMANTGCRTIELSNLRFSDVDFENRSVVLRSEKNATGSRIIPINDIAYEILKIRSGIFRDDDCFVFINDKKNKLTTDCLNKKLLKIQNKLGLKRKTIYSLRHTYATNLCNRNVNLEKVRLLLGHSQIRTTQKYVKIDFFELKKIVNGG